MHIYQEREGKRAKPHHSDPVCKEKSSIFENPFFICRKYNLARYSSMTDLDSATPVILFSCSNCSSVSARKFD